MEVQDINQPGSEFTRPAAQPATHVHASAARSATFIPAQLPGECPSCATAGAPVRDDQRQFVYAIGRIQPRFPSVGVEKEFAQAAGRADTAGLTDREALHKALADRANRYLARQLCWVLTIEGLETYLLVPRHSAEIATLVDAIRPAPHANDVDVVIGVRGPLAPPTLCGGLVLPVVVVDQLYSFDTDSLLRCITPPKEIAAKDFTVTAEEVFTRVMQLADNAGGTDEHRALNYLAVRYPALYALVAERHLQNCSWAGVDVRPSSLSGSRHVVDVILSFTHRQTDVTEKFFARVDVTEQFPFLVTKLSPYYER
jgi:PatG C-terminal